MPEIIIISQTYIHAAQHQDLVRFELCYILAVLSFTLLRAKVLFIFTYIHGVLNGALS